jgi:hypothetical protein
VYFVDPDEPDWTAPIMQDGDSEGVGEGKTLVIEVGTNEGLILGRKVVGIVVGEGAMVGGALGDADGIRDGLTMGCTVGKELGWTEGTSEG